MRGLPARLFAASALYAAVPPARKRKERSGKGETIFNLDKRRKSTFTDLNMSKKQRVQEFSDDPSWLDGLALKAEYNRTSNDDKFTFQVIADAQLVHAPYLHNKIIELLKRDKWYNNMGRGCFSTKEYH